MARFRTYIAGKTIIIIVIGCLLSATCLMLPGLPLVVDYFSKIGLPIQDSPYREPWTLAELQQYFIGQLPSDATNLDYEGKSHYALLKFDASPSNADRFVNRFCSGFLYQGYDPFRAVDSLSQNEGYLIETERDDYYLSSSPNAAKTTWGNRCFDLHSGGLYQLIVDKTNPTSYSVKYELLVVCNNQISPQRCDGNAIKFRKHNGLQVNGQPISFQSRYAQGDEWEIPVNTGAKYEAKVTLIRPGSNILRGSMLHVKSIALSVTGNGPNCEACWADEHGLATSGVTMDFIGAPSGKTIIRVFWFGDPGECVLEVREIKN